jgi:peptide chain release factor 1
VSLEENLERVLARYDELQSLMSTEQPLAPDEITRLSKEYSNLTPVVSGIKTMRDAQVEMEGLEAMREDESDPEMRAMAEAEFATLQKSDEAALFAADLLRMYQRYAEIRRWKFEIISLSETGIGGYKEGIASVSGTNVFQRLKFESGVHRVQRVPVTESGGRIHTSAATVAVMPEAEEVDVQIEEKDLRIDVFRASGPGGQSVNTTDSAVRITHIPTGIVVSQQDEKSQHKNRAKAMRVLRSRLYDSQRQALDDERAAARRSQVGSGDRSERIRTYNFPGRRVTDHRINMTLHQLDRILDGDLDELTSALLAEYHAQQLAEMT